MSRFVFCDGERRVTFGQEIESLSEHINDIFRRNSMQDASGPRETQTPVFQLSDVSKIRKWIAEGYSWIQSEGDVSNPCGSHLHVRVEHLDGSDVEVEEFEIFYRVLRALIPAFAPLFSAVHVREKGRFAFRILRRWAQKPPVWRNGYYRDPNDYATKSYWVFPHKDSTKPLTFELRLNESILPSAVLATSIMINVAWKFVKAGVKPIFTQDLLDLGVKLVTNNHRSPKSIDEYEIHLSKNVATNEIFKQLFGDKWTGEPVKFRRLMRLCLKNGLVPPNLAHWAIWAVKGEFWGYIRNYSEKSPNKSTRDYFKRL